MVISSFHLAAGFLFIVATFSWLNARILRLPTAVAMVIAGAACAGLLVGLRELQVSPDLIASLFDAVRNVDFQETVLGYLLAFLLFAGAMQVDLQALRRRFLPIVSLATLGVVVSTLLVGGGLWGLASLLGVDLSLGWAVAFGALICPTDPVAVLATVRTGGFSERLRSILLGEALFNDGVGIVVFGAAVSVAASGSAPDLPGLVGSVALEAVGGLVLGVASGLLVVRGLSAVDSYATEVMMTLALAAGVYAVAQLLGVSGPIAAVGAGLFVGERGMDTAMSDETRRYVRSFWKLIDEMLNAGLFLLLGLELAVAPPNLQFAGLALAAVLLVTMARWLTVAPWGAFFNLRRDESGATIVLAWGGIHGAISLALALSLPNGPARSVLLTVTFAVVIASILIQGLTFPRLARRLAPEEGGDA